MASSPETVASTIRTSDPASGYTFGWLYEVLDEEAELKLLALEHPLIDLALAQYSARFFSVVAPLFKVASHGSAIRCAALSNPTGAPGFPEILFLLRRGQHPKFEWTDDPQQSVAQWLQSAPQVELEALHLNPKLPDHFVRDLR